MIRSGAVLSAGLLALVLCGCASKPATLAASEDDAASALDKEVARAAMDYVQTEKDGVLLYCKKYRSIGSNIPTMKCITEAQLRADVENMIKYRDDLRLRGGKCTAGRQGSGGPCGAQ